MGNILRAGKDNLINFSVHCEDNDKYGVHYWKCFIDGVKVEDVAIMDMPAPAAVEQVMDALKEVVKRELCNEKRHNYAFDNNAEYAKNAALMTSTPHRTYSNILA